MRLADFLEAHTEQILIEWETFAASRLPASAAMDALLLRDHAPQILCAIAADLRQPQTAAEQATKSKGLVIRTPSGERTAAEVHGALRARSGFSMPHLVSEYRALRASVLRLWAATGQDLIGQAAAEDVTRFNEAIDQAVAESVDFFCQELDQARIARDVADRALALQRSRLEYATRLTRVGFWYCDLPFDVLEWDERVKEHFFFSPDERITIEDFYDRIHPEDRERTRLAIDASIQSRSPYDIVYRTRHPATGQVKWIRALGGTDYASDGHPIHFDGVTVDVTEERLEQQRVAESDARHRGVLANMDEAFTLFDPDFNIIDVNDSTCRLVGLPRSELVGTNHWERFPGTRDSELGRMYLDILADGKSRSLEHRYVFPDGRACWFDARAFMVGTGVAVLFRDVTERREIIDALRESDRRKDEFLAMLAHELRNPLAAIVTAGEVLVHRPDSRPPELSAAAVIRRQGRHLTRLVEDLLDVSRITQGRIQLRRAQVDVASVVAQAVETCQARIQAKQHRLTVSTTAAGPLRVEGDFERLVQCVTNVLTNAAKYTDPHGRIEVLLRDDSDDVVIEIVDSGSGISADLLPRVFDLFVQSDRTLDRSQGGLGVGLAVVKRLMEMHGGHVAAASDGEGRGSTFTLRLPLLREVSSSREESASQEISARRVLVVDDNVDLADSLVLLLQTQGHVAMAVHTAGSALQQIGDFEPDVVFVDIGLPDIDGYALGRLLRESPATGRLRLVALTGYGQPEDRKRALDSGFDAHLVKPVDLQKLQQELAANAATPLPSDI